MKIPIKNWISCMLLLCCVTILPAGARQVTDMAGRKVDIPDHLTRVLPYDNKTNVILFPVAGNLMIAKARAMESPMLKYISAGYLKLREVDTKNAEEVMKLRPDLIVVAAFTSAGEDLSNYTALSEKIRVPMVFVDLNLMTLDKTFGFLGQLLGKTDEAGTCADFIRSVYRDVENSRKTRIIQGKAYLANDNNGLRTAPGTSNHAQVFGEMNIRNAARAPVDAKGFATVSIEQVMMWNPDYIFCIGKGEDSPYRTVLKSALWHSIAAIKSKRVYPVPSEPFLWFDMPPSVNRILGLIWFSDIFYGQPADITRQKVMDFYRIFYKYSLTEKEYANLFVWK
jgi:iron complex transport system substrate-binding protein